MTEQYDLIIRKAVLRSNPKEKNDIAIHSGKIVKIAPKIDAKAVKEIDADGNLVTESYVNTHLHLCKVSNLNMME